MLGLRLTVAGLLVCQHLTCSYSQSSYGANSAYLGICQIRSELCKKNNCIDQNQVCGLVLDVLHQKKTFISPMQSSDLISGPIFSVSCSATTCDNSVFWWQQGLRLTHIATCQTLLQLFFLKRGDSSAATKRCNNA